MAMEFAKCILCSNIEHKSVLSLFVLCYEFCEQLLHQYFHQ